MKLPFKLYRAVTLSSHREYKMHDLDQKHVDHNTR